MEAEAGRDLETEVDGDADCDADRDLGEVDTLGVGEREMSTNPPPVSAAMVL